jgi:hypothetical protein
VPYVGVAIGNDEHVGQMVDAVEAVRAPGDAVAIRLAPGGKIFQWNLGVRDGRPEHPVALPIDDAAAYVYGDEPWNGRVWLVETDAHVTAVSVPGTVECAERRAVGPAYHLRCVQFASTTPH